MIEFWIAALAMLLAGYVFFIPALRAKTRANETDRARLNLILHRQRQQELATEVSNHAELDRLTAESERNLLDDLESASNAAPLETGTAGRPMVLVSLLILPVFGLLLYLVLGRADLVGRSATGMPQDVTASINVLAERLKQNPNDIQGWVLLGRSLQATNQPDKAITAYEFALKLAPDDLDLKAFYAGALAEAAQGSLAGRPSEIVAEILKRDPRHKHGLWMAGLAAVERRDLNKAVEYWEQLKSQFPPESEDARQIAQYIAEARGLPATAETSASVPPTPAATASGKSVRVKVTLGDDLKAKVAPEDALFIFARAAEGPPMPLAVVRKQARDLPLEVVLDDSMAMMQGMNLSSFERIILGARISKSGKPTPAPGDLQGLSEPLKLEKDGGYSVVIDRMVGGGS